MYLNSIYAVDATITDDCWMCNKTDVKKVAILVVDERAIQICKDCGENKLTEIVKKIYQNPPL
jgi:transcription elongation factor Elf1